MFGYVMANKPELKIREFDRYKGYYCGLCRQLKRRNGRLSQLTLTYDMTFLILLLSSLYEPAEWEERHRCMIHPGKKQKMIRNEITDYAADMNVLLSYYHFKDDWNDEKKVSGLFGMGAFARRAEKIAEKYPDKSRVIRDKLSDLAELERKNETRPDVISRPFGELMAELFCYRQDAFAEILRRFGFFLGKYIYLMDAYMDLEKDRKNGSFNPFADAWERADQEADRDGETTGKEGFEGRIMQMLEGTMREAVVEFEKLPLEMDLPILRNILYEGVKIPLIKRKQESESKEEKEHDK
ncbi:MAG: DUF5685 family protein [Roseburia sp.]|nr:DUF5685 family protein [Roseburia sp.]